MRTTPRLLTFILLGLLLVTLLALPTAFALAQETTTPTEEITVTQEAETTATEEIAITEEAETTATQEVEAADAEGSTGEEAAAAVESARETASTADASSETEAETDQPALGTMMMVIGFIAVVVTGGMLWSKDRDAKDDVV